MARPKGSPKVGGRKKGTPNKVTTDLKEWVRQILDGQRAAFMENMAMLEPNEFVGIYAKLLNYVMPKQQAISVEAQIQAEYQQLEQLLDKAPAEIVDAIAERVLALQAKNLKHE